MSHGPWDLHPLVIISAFRVMRYTKYGNIIPFYYNIYFALELLLADRMTNKIILEDISVI